MDLIEKLKILSKKEWSSQMALNNTKQYNSGIEDEKICHWLDDGYKLSEIVTRCQTWRRTPQGSDYWSRRISDFRYFMNES